MVQWLRLQAPNAGGRGLIPGQGTTSHMLTGMPQRRILMLQLKILHAAMKTQHRQTNELVKRKLWKSNLNFEKHHLISFSDTSLTNHHQIWGISGGYFCNGEVKLRVGSVHNDF